VFLFREVDAGLPVHRYCCYAARGLTSTDMHVKP